MPAEGAGCRGASGGQGGREPLGPSEAGSCWKSTEDRYSAAGRLWKLRGVGMLSSVQLRQYLARLPPNLLGAAHWVALGESVCSADITIAEATAVRTQSL